MSRYLDFKAGRIGNAYDKTASVPWYADPMAQAGIGAGLGGLAGAGIGYGMGGGMGALVGGLGGAALGGGLGYAHGMYDPFGFNFAMLSDQELKEAIVAAKQVNDPILEVLMQELQRRDQGAVKTGGSNMLHPYWRDKIAATAEAAEEALAQEAAGNEQQAAMQQGGMEQGAPGEEEMMAAKLEEDIQIAEELMQTDLPLETKVQILEEQEVEPEVIEEVIQVETVDAVAAYYGVNPAWLHDKTATGWLNPIPLTGAALGGLIGAGAGVNPYSRGYDVPKGLGGALLGAGVGYGAGHLQKALISDVADSWTNPWGGGAYPVAVDQVASAYGMPHGWIDKQAAKGKLMKKAVEPLKRTVQNYGRSMAGNPAGMFGGRLKAVRTALFGKGGMAGTNLGKAYLGGAGLTGAGALGTAGYHMAGGGGQPQPEFEGAGAGAPWYGNPYAQAGMGAAGGGLLGAGIGYGLGGGRGAAIGGALGALGGGAAGHQYGPQVQQYLGY